MEVSGSPTHTGFRGHPRIHMSRYNETDDDDDSRNFPERNDNDFNSYVHDGRTVVYECK